MSARAACQLSDGARPGDSVYILYAMIVSENWIITGQQGFFISVDFT